MIKLIDIPARNGINAMILLRVPIGSQDKYPLYFKSSADLPSSSMNIFIVNFTRIGNKKQLGCYANEPQSRIIIISLCVCGRAQTFPETR